MKDLLHKLSLTYYAKLDPFFHIAVTKFKTRAENKVWKYTVESYHCIFDESELQFITKGNVKTLGENLKTPCNITF